MNRASKVAKAGMNSNDINQVNGVDWGWNRQAKGSGFLEVEGLGRLISYALR
jgi:hypothetical protein